MTGEGLAERSNALERHTTDRILHEFEIGAADVVVIIVPAFRQCDVEGHHVEAEAPEGVEDPFRTEFGHRLASQPAAVDPVAPHGGRDRLQQRQPSREHAADRRPLRPPRESRDAIEEASAVDEHLTPGELHRRREVGRVRVDRHGSDRAPNDVVPPGVVEREVDRTQQPERVAVAPGERQVLERVGEFTIGFQRWRPRARAARWRARDPRRAAPAAPRERADAVRTGLRRLARGTDHARTPGAGARRHRLVR